MPRHLPRGLDGRTRDQTPPKAGEIRQKRADTRIGTLRQEYGDNFAKGYRSDTKLGTFRDDMARAFTNSSRTRKSSPRSINSLMIHWNCQDLGYVHDVLSTGMYTGFYHS